MGGGEQWVVASSGWWLAVGGGEQWVVASSGWWLAVGGGGQQWVVDSSGWWTAVVGGQQWLVVDRTLTSILAKSNLVDFSSLHFCIFFFMSYTEQSTKDSL